MCTRAMIMSAQGPMAPDSPDWAYPSRHRFPPERKKGKGASNSLLSLAICSRVMPESALPGPHATPYSHSKPEFPHL